MSVRRARVTQIFVGFAASACIAAAVHAGFDFDWHVPLIPLTLAALVGVVVGSTGSDRMFPEKIPERRSA